MKAYLDNHNLTPISGWSYDTVIFRSVKMSDIVRTIHIRPINNSSNKGFRIKSL